MFCVACIEWPPDRDGRGAQRSLPGEEQLHADRDPLTVQCNDTAFGSKITGKELGTMHGLANCLMQLCLCHAREGYAAGAASCIWFAEE